MCRQKETVQDDHSEAIVSFVDIIGFVSALVCAGIQATWQLMWGPYCEQPQMKFQ